MSVAQAKRRRLSEQPSNPAFSNTTTMCASTQRNSSTECDDCEICERNGLGEDEPMQQTRRRRSNFTSDGSAARMARASFIWRENFKRSAQRLGGVGLKDTSAGQSSTLRS
ncbi:unnamed protein product [Sphagnum troendelagicum]